MTRKHFLKHFHQIPKSTIAAVLVGAIAIFAWVYMATSATSAISGGERTVVIKVPEFSRMAAAGKVAFDANCAKCHGKYGDGTEKGPPFMHEIYNPGHHPDEAFIRAARQGVRQHHWPYGDMPPQPDVTDGELTEIVRYVRELQEANGIVYQRHQM